MGKVVQLNSYRATGQTDTSSREDHHALLSECENLKSDLIEMLEGFQKIKETISEYNKQRGRHLKG
ncbi:MAG: hypothetical protein KUA37_08130 [Desulfomicrobium sp.]|uniref:hypothetical protein n=1 Tax=Hoeflea sp. TaxID=1940281 RepID=UPI0025BF888F|nr:hypothetical protein [Hoeflea sp.]MBU4528029.1 hypothetical protein [Alphaproteobacteria bacterium]MBV1711959.1 hypothetical protein [Desulfomicrobium sp.]MBV1785476.1 hypothetical protein [Hoeflea sp.]